MRTKALLLLVALLLLPFGPAGAADTDLLKSKVTYALAKLVDAIASEPANTANHATRLAVARAIDANLNEYARRYATRMYSAYPTSRDVCVTDTLTGDRNCTNSVTEAIIYDQVVGLFGNSVNLELAALVSNVLEDRLAAAPGAPAGEQPFEVQVARSGQ